MIVPGEFPAQDAAGRDAHRAASRARSAQSSENVHRPGVGQLAVGNRNRAGQRRVRTGDSQTAGGINVDRAGVGQAAGRQKV